MNIYIVTALMSDGQLRRELAISEIPPLPKKKCLIESLNKVGRQARESACHSYAEFVLTTEYEFHRESRAAAVPIATADSHGSSRAVRYADRKQGGERGYE